MLARSSKRSSGWPSSLSRQVAAAACEGRDYTLPDDVKSLFLPLARHRVIVTTAAEMEDVKAEQVLREVIAQVPAPR